MKIFEKISPENTPVAIKLAIEKAKEISTDIVLASSSGATAFAVLELASEMDYTGQIIAITSVWKSPGVNQLSDENRKKLTESGVILVTAGHALSGVERSLSGKFNGVYPVEIMAHTLRMISEGVKVCAEIGAMALDAGAIREPHAVVALGGTGRGCDTACVITPGYSAKIFDMRIHEILCKPY
ncbi:MAG: hypothetical protein FWD23_07950 [Oscillospiraceae bacterium]|nr:hypothetical protein [Oscillospiraceae bacterium]